MPNFRITRASFYDKGTPGHTDPSARQGYYVEAEDAKHALWAAAREFPGETLDCQSWDDDKNYKKIVARWGLMEFRDGGERLVPLISSATPPDATPAAKPDAPSGERCGLPRPHTIDQWCSLPRNHEPRERHSWDPPSAPEEPAPGEDEADEFPPDDICTRCGATRTTHYGPDKYERTCEAFTMEARSNEPTECVAHPDLTHHYWLHAELAKVREHSEELKRALLSATADLASLRARLEEAVRSQEHTNALLQQQRARAAEANPARDLRAANEEAEGLRKALKAGREALDYLVTFSGHHGYVVGVEPDRWRTFLRLVEAFNVTLAALTSAPAASEAAAGAKPRFTSLWQTGDAAPPKPGVTNDD